MSNEIGLKRGTVILKKHHNEWIKSFNKEEQTLRKLLGGVILDIQHIGSTAVPNLAAKPIIDMLMGIHSLSEVSQIREILENAGYEYRENGSDDMQVLFVKGSEEKRTHYLHITVLGSRLWKNDLAFRDYLRSNSEEAAKYERLKHDLAKQYADLRELYTKGKSDYIQSVLTKVLEK